MSPHCGKCFSPLVVLCPMGPLPALSHSGHCEPSRGSPACLATFPFPNSGGRVCCYDLVWPPAGLSGQGTVSGPADLLGPSLASGHLSPPSCSHSLPVSPPLRAWSCLRQHIPGVHPSLSPGSPSHFVPSCALSEVILLLYRYLTVLGEFLTVQRKHSFSSFPCS